MSTEKAPDTKTETRKTEARKPRGLQDRGPADMAATEAMMAKIREVYSRYGFDALETPFLEYTDALGKFLPDQDRPNAGVFSLRDDDDQWMSLRYDLTAPLARYCAENWQNLPKPYRSYRAGWVFRNEKPGPGRFRQFMQFDADTVGASSVAADAEMCMMAADTLEALGIPRGQYVIKVNNRKVLDGAMDRSGLVGKENAEKRLIALRALDKIDRLGWEGVQQLFGEGRRDESGDFTKGAQLSDSQQLHLIAAFNAGNPSELFRRTQSIYKNSNVSKFLNDYQNGNIASIVNRHFYIETVDKNITGGKLHNLKFADGSINLIQDNILTAKNLKEYADIDNSFKEGAEELFQMAVLFRASGYESDRIMIDTSVVRGLEYYTGPVYEAELLFDVTDEDGKPVRFGSVGGGGRYDGLVSRFLNEPVPATGFSIGVSRLLAALQALGKVSTTPEPGPVLVLAMDRDAEGMAAYQKIVAELRSAGIRSEIYLGSSGMKAQMKYADRRGSPVAVIQGSSERGKEWVDPATGEKETGTAQIKDLILGGELANATRGEDRAEYIEKMKAEAQFEVPVSGIVAAVKKVLARRG